MKRRSRSRNSCVLLLANSLSVFLFNQSLFPTPQDHPRRLLLSLPQLFFSPGRVLHSSAPPQVAAKPTLPQLNLHNTRVRRNPSGFLQVAVSKARNLTVLVCAPCLLALPIQH
jgi:hypothetical protein